MQEHIEGMREVQMTDYEEVDKILNVHMKLWCKIMNASDRLSHNYQTTNNEVPPLYGMRKDHKEFDDLEKGPPTRPVCGAIVACNYRISYFISQFLKPLVKSAPEACTSTEDLLHRINECNNNNDLNNHIVGSMDVKALYPSIDVNFATEKCCDLIYESDIKFEEVDSDELGLFIALTCSTNEYVPFKSFCPTRKSKKGPKPTITASGSKKQQEDRWRPWNKPEQIPSENDIRKMFVFALGISIKVTLSKHIYRFNNKLYQQSRGGAIGVGLSGELANVFMIWWDRQFVSDINRLGIEHNLYSRYVDDIEVITKAIETEGEQKDRATMLRLQEVANAIHPSIQVTIDYPSAHENNRLPVLDIEQWISPVTVDHSTKHQVLHSHYMKKIASKRVIAKSSALADRTKKNILINDLLRVMKNISYACGEDEFKKHVQYYMKRMQFSGYSQQERVYVYRIAKKKFDTIVKLDKDGVQPMYRSKFWEANKRTIAKKHKRNTWYENSGEYETTFFVDATPDSELALKCTKIMKTAGLPIRIIEKAGTSIKQALVKSNPFPQDKCNSDECAVCQIDPTINCKKREVVYRINCRGEMENAEQCTSKYEGETSRSIGERCNEHMKIYKEKKASSAIYKHVLDKHGGEIQDMSLEIVSAHPGDAMLRQVSEAVLIKLDSPDMNTKDEWSYSNVPRPRRVSPQ